MCCTYLIDLIESVQRKFTKRIPSLSKLSYIQRLNSIGLESLEFQRLRFYIINYCKILNGLFLINPFNRFLIQQPISSYRSSVPQKPLRCKSQLSNSFFSIGTRTFATLFQSLLKLYLLWHFLNHELKRLISPHF